MQPVIGLSQIRVCDLWFLIISKSFKGNLDMELSICSQRDVDLLCTHSAMMRR